MVVSGKKKFLDVLFPRGNFSLINGTYTGNFQPIYNNLVADITRYVLDRKENIDTIKIIELGAGTGSSTRYVLERIADLKDKLEYYFTDLSGGLIRSAKKTYKEKYEFVNFDILNINENPGMQGFESGSFDIVIANNVLHATKNIKVSLKHIYKLLKPTGWLILNDVTMRLDFNTCIFGLTSEWFSFEDEEIRIPFSPILSLDTWRHLLSEVGFVVHNLVVSPEIPVSKSFQSIIPAYKN